MKKRSSCVCTLVTQISLCFALYIAFNIGTPHPHITSKSGNRKHLDIYFITVMGGFRPLKQQTLILKQMNKVMKLYNVQFVISVSESGEEDPLFKNATSYFQILKVPWYMTRSLKGHGLGYNYYQKKINLPLGKTLHVIAVDSALFAHNQLLWLEKTLKETNSDWRIVVGYNSLINCTTNDEQLFEYVDPLQRILQKYGVDAYISGQACSNSHSKGKYGSGIFENKGPFLTSVNNKLLHIKENVDGFFLHRVSPLEFVSYFITLEKGESVSIIVFQPRGREFM